MSGGPQQRDYSGFRSGRLVVVSDVERMKGRRRLRCRCDCGEEKVVESRHLLSGATKSCGCFQKESKRGRKTPAGTPMFIDFEGWRLSRNGWARRLGLTHSGFSKRVVLYGPVKAIQMGGPNGKDA